MPTHLQLAPLQLDPSPLDLSPLDPSPLDPSPLDPSPLDPRGRELSSSGPASPPTGSSDALPLEPVDVLLDRHLQPAQFLWRDGLWLVRTAQRQEQGTVLPVVHPGPALAAWRVSAGRGRSGPHGSYALVRDAVGGWWLRELAP